MGITEPPRITTSMPPGRSGFNARALTPPANHSWQVHPPATAADRSAARILVARWIMACLFLCATAAVACERPRSDSHSTPTAAVHERWPEQREIRRRTIRGACKGFCRCSCTPLPLIALRPLTVWAMTCSKTSRSYSASEQLGG